MAVPLDGVRAIHNAFRKDLSAMDAAANTAVRQGGSSDLVLNRYKFFNEVLVWHASGEEDAVFPALEKAAPLVAEAYERDHRGLDILYLELNHAVSELDKLDIARATARFNFHLHFHLDKEEAHLYRIFNERIPIPEQGGIVAKMSQKIPLERFPEVIAWLFPLIGTNDRENMVRIWQQALPPPVFAKMTGLIQAATGDGWAEITKRIPELK
ncbi:MAG: hemerythrin domain-containing protein [Dehalococcoidales bacterium]|jgi:hemerythrin-like domain-containing protein